ncbi:TPA: dATP/dGTP pyrophosphohydrolase domain-containing protein [Pseudomonas aeruginosa]|uniref:dATP/dGTP pyrophosphohydrolase domain-containing protein n=1 Tax=Pseudomonas aeruginosa TaxID=287 RepID=UPI001F1F3002|nr:dATP/dGTP pyrophosphohydrolase domain-containing protein [Pseudomonas aeruginosa]
MSAENSDSINAAMSQAQVFTSAWSLVGGPFDSGDAMAHANEAKQELHDMLKVLHGTGFSFEQHLHRQREFSERTFGPGPRAAGVIDHIRKELREIEEAPGDLAEWIDVVILALDGAWRTGATPAQIIDALVAKQAKNEARTWPDWRTAPADRAIEHDRADEPVDDNTYFVMRNAGGAVFVKHGPFFVSQGGLTEDWGKNWKRIRAGSLKHARQVGEELLP